MRFPTLSILASFTAIGVCVARAELPSRSAVPMAVIEALIDGAAQGAVVVVPPGVYEGNLRVGRAVVLDGRGAVTLDGRGKGTVVEIASPGVTFRGFTVRGSGETVQDEPAAVRVTAGPVVVEDNRVEDALFGIDLREASGSTVRRNSVRGKRLEPGRRGDGIRLWWSHGCTVESNEVAGSRDLVFWYSENLRVASNRVSDSRYGLHFMYSHDTVLSGNELSANSVGVYLMYSNRITLTGNRMTNNRGASGYGLGLKDCDEIVVTGNAMLANRIGVYVDNSPSSVGSTGLIEGNMIAFNEIGLLATPNTHDNVVVGNAFVENEEQAATHGRGRLTANAFSRDGRGNFWSDYAGFDRDADGLGDLTHEPRSLFGALMAREPNLRLFVHSPAQQAVEFTARAMPELRPEPTLVDPAPLSRPPALSISTDGAARGRGPIAALGAGLIAVAAGLLLLGRRQWLPVQVQEVAP